ncbi:hypothetical protein B1748_10470 [Paenibacillus sp. MY03]|uniref:hypothetical protein n=1 Tax=Paenibacillus sp. MY03 TaxID=302980 RepID=UPI000B3C3998|nr:hypothetical protein [Paenibacillus sp. MY03]OUS76988.1 hypothetical protein B1748_10470 [Paenibacillus sp. MY03]
MEIKDAGFSCKYLLFGFDSPFVHGGLNDFLIGFNTSEEFEERFVDSEDESPVTGFDNYQILCTQFSKTVYFSSELSLLDWVQNRFELE